MTPVGVLMIQSSPDGSQRTLIRFGEKLYPIVMGEDIAMLFGGEDHLELGPNLTVIGYIVDPVEDTGVKR